MMDATALHVQMNNLLARCYALQQKRDDVAKNLDMVDNSIEMDALLEEDQKISQYLLLAMMQIASIRHYGCLWKPALEFILWDVARFGGGDFGFAEMSDGFATNILKCAKDAIGWWTWSGDSPSFVAWNAWIELYNNLPAEMEVA